VTVAYVELAFHRGHGIELSLRPFEELLAGGREGLRSWELFRTDGPEALLHYVDARPVRAGPVYHHWNTRLDAELRAALLHWCESHMVPEGITPAAVADEARTIVDRTLAELERRWPEVIAARDAAACLPDPLVAWELELLWAGEHPNDRLRAREPSELRVSAYERVRPTRSFPDAIHDLLDEALAHPGLKGLTHRGSGDWKLLRRGCHEQLRRCGGVPRGDENEFPISVLAPWTGTADNDPYVEAEDWRPSLSPYPAWTRGVRFQFEGFILYDVYVEDENTLGGWDHSVADRRPSIRRNKQTKEASVHQAKLVLAGYDDPLRASFRHWLQHPCGWFAGVLAEGDAASDLLQIVQRHGFVMQAEATP
jgi:hypothetical protein